MDQVLLTTESADGTEIAYETDGAGPPLVIVGGALNGRGTAAVLLPQLADRFTVVRYDRRGRGDSGDTPPYAPEREVEDLEAVIAAVGGPVYAFGHSSGAALVLFAARRGAPIVRMVLYEPPFLVDDGREPLPADWLERLRAASPADAVELFLTEAVGVPAPMVEQMKAGPMWPQLVAIGHTVLYDNTIMWPYQQGEPLPRQWADEVRTTPTLVIDGGKSPAWMRNAAAATAELLPGARALTLADCDHGAPPEVIGPVLSDFFEGGER
jgi:pimeloyl-ACP methyl ester carboxylesterase